MLAARHDVDDDDDLDYKKKKQLIQKRLSLCLPTNGLARFRFH